MTTTTTPGSARPWGALLAISMLAGCGDHQPPPPPPPPSMPSGPSVPNGSARAAPAPSREAPSLPTHLTADEQATDLGRDLARAPRWAYSQETGRAAAGPRHRTNAPQVGNALDMLDTLGDDAVAAGHGLLLCRVSIARDRNWDSRGLFGASVAPDATVRVQLGAAPELTIRLPEDTYEAGLSVPNVTLAADTAMHWYLVDRDLARDDTIGSVDTPWDGNGVDGFDVGAAHLRCRLAPQVWLDRRVAEAGRRASASVARLLATPIRASAGASGPNGPGMDEVRHDLHALAAFVGWSDPRVEAPRARLEAWEARYWAAHAEQVRALAAHAAAKGTATALGSSLSVRLDAFSCDSSEIAFPCAARFTLTRVPGHAARHPSPVTVDVIAPGVPAGDCMPTSSSVRAPWGVPTADEPAAVLSARCRGPEAAATTWLVLVRTGGDEAALFTGL